VHERDVAVADSATPGDMVNVDMGTYAEQVTIGISLTLTGAGAGHTKIQAPATLPPLGDVVQIKGSGVSVEMSALTVAGLGPSASGQGSINDGIHVMNGAQGILHDLAVVDIRDNPLTGAQNGRAIRVGDTDPPNAATAVIHDCTILNYQKNGIDVRDAASTLDARALFTEGAKLVAAGHDPMSLKRGVDGPSRRSSRS
jgi:hypothetical protein